MEGDTGTVPMVLHGDGRLTDVLSRPYQGGSSSRAVSKYKNLHNNIIYPVKKAVPRRAAPRLVSPRCWE